MKCLFCILTIGLMLSMCLATLAATFPQKHSRVTQQPSPRLTNRMLLSLIKNGQDVSHKSLLTRMQGFTSQEAKMKRIASLEARMKRFISLEAGIKGFTSQEARKKRFTSPNLASIYH